MVYSWIKGFLKKIYFNHGTPYVGAILILSLFIGLAISREVALPVFGAVGAGHLANPAALLSQQESSVGLGFKLVWKSDSEVPGQSVSTTLLLTMPKLHSICSKVTTTSPGNTERRSL